LVRLLGGTDVSDTGRSPRSQMDRGPTDESGYPGQQRPAHHRLPYIVWFFFGAFSPFQKRTAQATTEGGLEQAGDWQWIGVKGSMMAMYRSPVALEFGLAGWIIGSFLLVVPFAVTFVLNLLGQFLPSSIVFNVFVLIAVFSLVALFVSVALPLLVVNWVGREVVKEDVRNLEESLAGAGYGYEGGDGSSLDQAVVLRGDLRGRKNIGLAGMWLQARHGDPNVGWALVNRRPLTEGHRRIEEWVIELAGGKQKTIYFELGGPADEVS
jgi:hypothetical protein